jgi:hypothetical protein
MAAVVFEDLSGTATPVSESDNPYQPLIDSANDDPVCEPQFMLDIQFGKTLVNNQVLPNSIGRNTSPLLNPPHHQNRTAEIQNPRSILLRMDD